MTDRMVSLNASRAIQMMEASARHALTRLQALQTAEGFQLSTGAGTSLLGTCYAILLLEGLEKLAVESEATRSKWARYLQSFQQADSGIFCRDEKCRPNELGSFLTYSQQAIRDTYYALHALDALGSQAPFSLKLTPDFVHPGNGVDLMNGLDWSDPLQQSDRLMYLLAFLAYRFEVEGHSPSAGLFYRLLSRLNTAEDPKMGFYGAQGKTHPAVGAAAGARLIPFYEYVHCPIIHQGRKIDTLLGLPQEVEAFSVEGPVGWYDFLALTRSLAALSKTAGYRSDEIRDRLAWSFQVIYDQHMGIGAFPSLAKEEGGDAGEHTLLNTWLCLSTLAASACALFEDFPLSELWQFRRTPALGYYHPQNGLDERERRILPQWIQTRNLAVESLPTPVPTVSVVISCYNLGVYLAEAVDSVLAQTRQDFEIIIVDDGSTDEFTCLMLETIRQPKTRIIRQTNRGLAAARNAGILQAQGNFICCLDADDLLAPNYLELTAPVLEREAETGFVSTFYCLSNELEDVVAFPTCDFPELLIENRGTGTSLFRKEAWNEVGGYCETLPFFEDWDFWIALVEAGWRCTVVPEVLFEYRIRLNSMYQTALRTPDKWRAVVADMVNRHPRSFTRYVSEVVGGLNSMIAVQLLGKAWWQGQANNWQALAHSQERSITGLKTWIETLQQGKLWLEGQTNNSQRLAEQREAEKLALKARINELEGQMHQLEAQLGRQQEQRPWEERVSLTREEPISSRLSRWLGWGHRSGWFEKGRKERSSHD